MAPLVAMWHPCRPLYGSMYFGTSTVFEFAKITVKASGFSFHCVIVDIESTLLKMTPDVDS